MDPLALKRGDTVPFLHPTLGPQADIAVTGVPVHFANARVGFDRPAPFLGQHNDDVYQGLLGYTGDRSTSRRRRDLIWDRGRPTDASI